MAISESIRPLAAFLLVILGWLGVSPGLLSAQSARIKDIANIRGVRTNQMIGFGLVVGLNKTGDTKKSLATNRAAANMLTRLGMKTATDEVVAGNIAAVIATVDMPAFARNGDRVDVRLSTVGDAKSLAGGTLLMTPLKAGDSKIYAIAQGNVVVGGASGQGPQILTVATIPSGAVVEKEFVPQIANCNREGCFINLTLKRPDFTTSTRIADVINKKLRGFFAESEDVSGIRVKIPPSFREKLVEFVSTIESLKVTTDNKAVVVLNERTGTVVMGSSVVINPVTISHGDLMIQVQSKDKNSSNPKKVVNFGGTTVGELLETMNALGIKPLDFVGILQAIHAAGALQADLKFI